jgi:hypothetical protein
VLGWLGLGGSGPLDATAKAATPALLEPASGTYFGVNLDWGSNSAENFNKRLGVQAAVYVQFVKLPLTDADNSNLDGFIQQVAAVGGLALITVEPSVPLDSIGPSDAAALAARLAAINAAGTPAFVRFAHEMNGSWYAWGEQPRAYVQAFRLIASAVHAQAPKTAMIWAPNYGAGYPFAGGQYEAKPGSPDFALLDTNKDGKLDQTDDMYAPYYPGDDAVDWVGMTIYHWGDRYPWGKNILPEPGKFEAQITGSYNGAGGDDRTVPNFYKIYAEGHQKPMAIPETAAFYNTTVIGDAEDQIKQAWWRQVFGAQTLADLPRIKMINWFEWRKPESEVGNAVVDWTMSSNPALAAAFLKDLPRDHFLFATDLPGLGITSKPPS